MPSFSAYSEGAFKNSENFRRFEKSLPILLPKSRFHRLLFEGYFYTKHRN